MQDITVAVLSNFVGGTLIATHVAKPMKCNGDGRMTGWFILLIYAAGILGFFGFTWLGGTVKLDISPLFAGLLKLLGLSLCLASAWLGYRNIVPVNITPPAHPSRTPPAP